MGGEQSQPEPPLPPQKQRGSRVAPAMGARGQSISTLPSGVIKQDNTKFIQDLLAAHNEYRARHKVPPLKLNKKLCTVAQEWAERISKTGSLEPRPQNFPYGQNLYYSRWATDPESITKSWYKEGNKYHYDKEPNPPPVTNVNFTQMMWKSTTDVGVGVSTSWQNVTYIVANYKPKGNVKGEYMKNLLPPAALEKADSGGVNVKRRVSVEDKNAAAKIVSVPEKKINAANIAIFQKKMLQLINEFRDSHSAKPLKLNNVLNELAQKHAEYMAEKKKVEPFKGKIAPPIGTSIYCSKWYTDPKDACGFWYSECKRYKYDEPSIVSTSTVDFVQMVWQSTKDVGFGRAEMDAYVYIAAFYRPVGNVLGEFTKNVKPFRASSNMSVARTSIQGTRRESKSMSVVLPPVT